MDTPNNLTDVKNISQAEASQGNKQRIILFWLAGVALTLILATAVIITRTNGNDVTRMDAIPASVPYSSNALEMQYARPWLDAQSKVTIPYGNALEMQYAQPWLAAQKKAIISYGNALEMQYAQPWLDAQKSFDCSQRLDMFYACQNAPNSYGK